MSKFKLKLILTFEILLYQNDLSIESPYYLMKKTTNLTITLCPVITVPNKNPHPIFSEGLL